MHPGADDNASGTAGVIELARWFSREPQHKRGILFLTFAGEELGLLGSSYYVNHPAAAAQQRRRHDQHGHDRPHPRRTRFTSAASAPEHTFADLLKQLAPKHDFEADVTERAGYGSSDHTSFTTKQVPVLFFFSGLHADYHKPSDTWDKIDAPDAVRLLDLVADVTDHLTDGSPRPQFVRVAETQPPGEVAPTRTRASVWPGTAPISAASPTSPRFPTASGSPTSGPARPPPKPV